MRSLFRYFWPKTSHHDIVDNSLSVFLLTCTMEELRYLAQCRDITTINRSRSDLIYALITHNPWEGLT